MTPTLTNYIAVAALVVSVLSLLYSFGADRRRRTEGVEVEIRDRLEAVVNPLLFGISAAELAYEPADPPMSMQEWRTSGLHELGLRLRRRGDRRRTAEIASQYDHIGALWVDSNTAWGRWNEENTDEEGMIVGGERADEAFKHFDVRRKEFISQGQAFLRAIEAERDRINARHR